jgi:uncharacterized protein YqjF (DUF2071 family)
VHGALELDLFDGRPWLTVSAFRVSGARLRGFPPAPGLSSFAQVNVRTYVRHEDRPGIWFLGLDLSSAAVPVLRALGLPAHRARVSIERRGAGFEASCAREDADRPRVLSARWQPSGPAAEPEPGSLEHFLVERFRLYARGRRGSLRQAEAHHRPWALQPAVGEIELNTLVPGGIALSGELLLHYSHRQDFLVWRLGAA